MRGYWPAIRLAFLLVCLGALPLPPETPPLMVFLLTALAVVASFGTVVRDARHAVCARVTAAPLRRDGASGAWPAPPGPQIAPGEPGTVRSRAPSGSRVARG